MTSWSWYVLCWGDLEYVLIDIMLQVRDTYPIFGSWVSLFLIPYLGLTSFLIHSHISTVAWLARSTQR